jgi:hypothetical protein
MTARPVPKRHWRSYGDTPLPTGAEALDEPFSAFPSWFMRITCDRCGEDRMVNEAHTAHRDMPIRDLLNRMRHERLRRTCRQGGAAAHRSNPRGCRPGSYECPELAATLRRRTTVPWAAGGAIAGSPSEPTGRRPLPPS